MNNTSSHVLSIPYTMPSVKRRMSPHSSSNRPRRELTSLGVLTRDDKRLTGLRQCSGFLVIAEAYFGNHPGMHCELEEIKFTIPIFMRDVDWDRTPNRHKDESNMIGTSTFRCRPKHPSI